MRTRSFFNSFMTALFVAAPLLASCGGTVSSGVMVDPNGLNFPDCQDGQLIGVNPDKTLFCVSALSANFAPPSCLPGTQALTSEKDPVTMQNVAKCVNKGSGTNDVTTSTRITNATTAVNNLATQVTQIQSGGGLRSKFVGLSTAMVSGKVVSGNVIGLNAAKLICEGQYLANAHACTPFEIYESVVSAKAGDPLDGTADVGQGIVYLESWSNPFNGPFPPLAATDDPSAGQNESCGSFQYPTADKKWKITLFNFTTNAKGVRTPRFDATAGCSGSYKIACCK